MFFEDFTTTNKQVSLDDFSVSNTDAFNARIDEALTRSPTTSITRFIELDSAKRTTPRGFIDEFGEEELPPDPLGAGSPILTKIEANEIGNDVGLSFDEPITKKAFDIMFERKKAENLRRDKISRAKGGVLAGTVGIAGELITTMLDPLNVASAFVPIVSQARFVSLAARFGTTRARAIRGGTEGFVGASLVEPFVLAAASQEQADYNAYDSLINLSFGAVVGSGLHVGFGKIGDSINARAARAAVKRAVEDGDAIALPAPSKRTPVETGDLKERLDAASTETKEAALRSTLIDLDQSRHPEPSEILELDDGYRSGGETIHLRKSTYEAFDGEPAPSDKHSVFTINRGDEDIGFVEVRDDGESIRIENVTVKDAGLPDAAADPNASASREFIDEMLKGGAVNSLGTRTMRRLLLQLRKAFPNAKRITGERVSGARKGGQHVFEGEGLEVDIALPRLTKKERAQKTQEAAQSAANRAEDPRSARFADFEAAEAAKQRVDDAPKGTDIEQLEALEADDRELLNDLIDGLTASDIELLQDAGALNKDGKFTALAELDEAVDDARKFADGVQAFAKCMMRG